MSARYSRLQAAYHCLATYCPTACRSASAIATGIGIWLTTAMLSIAILAGAAARGAEATSDGQSEREPASHTTPAAAATGELTAADLEALLKRSPTITSEAERGLAHSLLGFPLTEAHRQAIVASYQERFFFFDWNEDLAPLDKKLALLIPAEPRLKDRLEQTQRAIALLSYMSFEQHSWAGNHLSVSIYPLDVSPNNCWLLAGIATYGRSSVPGLLSGLGSLSGFGYFNPFGAGGTYVWTRDDYELALKEVTKLSHDSRDSELTVPWPLGAWHFGEQVLLPWPDGRVWQIARTPKAGSSLTLHGTLKLPVREGRQVWAVLAATQGADQQARLIVEYRLADGTFEVVDLPIDQAALTVEQPPPETTQLPKQLSLPRHQFLGYRQAADLPAGRELVCYDMVAEQVRFVRLDGQVRASHPLPLVADARFRDSIQQAICDQIDLTVALLLKMIEDVEESELEFLQTLGPYSMFVLGAQSSADVVRATLAKGVRYHQHGDVDLASYLAWESGQLVIQPLAAEAQPVVVPTDHFVFHYELASYNGQLLVFTKEVNSLLDADAAFWPSNLRADGFYGGLYRHDGQRWHKLPDWYPAAETRLTLNANKELPPNYTLTTVDGKLLMCLVPQRDETDPKPGSRFEVRSFEADGSYQIVLHEDRDEKIRQEQQAKREVRQEIIRAILQESLRRWRADK